MGCAVFFDCWWGLDFGGFCFWRDEALLGYVAEVLFCYFLGSAFFFVPFRVYCVEVIVSVDVCYVSAFLFVFCYPVWIRFVSPHILLI